MKRYRIPILVLIILLLFLLIRGCGSAREMKRSPDFSLDQTYKAIPPEATLITTFNTSAVLDEINFEKLKRSASYISSLEKYYPQNPPFTRVFSDPVAAGIDTSKKIVFYISVGNEAKEVYSNSMLALQNRKDFEKVVKKSNRGSITRKKYYSYSIIDPQNAVAWNDELVMFLSTDPSMEKIPIFQRCLAPVAVKFFDENKPFYDFILQSDADMAFWLDLESYSKNQILASGKPGEINSYLLKGNNVYGEADSRNGLIELDVRFDFNDLFSAVQNKLFKPGFDSEIINIIPGNKPSFLLNTSLNIDGIFSVLLDDIDLKVEARNSLANYGLTLDDLTKALTGDISIVTFPTLDPSKSATLFAVKIKDPVHFNVLLDVWQDLGEIEREDENVYKINKGVIPFFPIAATYEDKLQRLIIIDQYAYVSLDRDMIEHLRKRVRDSFFTENILITSNEEEMMLNGFMNRNFRQASGIANQYGVDAIKFKYQNEQLTLYFQFLDNSTPALSQILASEF